MQVKLTVRSFKKLTSEDLATKKRRKRKRTGRYVKHLMMPWCESLTS